MLESYPHHCKFFLVKCIISYRNNIYITNFLKYTSFQLNLLLSSHYLPFIIVSKNKIRLELYIFRSYNERITNKYCISFLTSTFQVSILEPELVYYVHVVNIFYVTKERTKVFHRDAEKSRIGFLNVY